MLDRNEVVPGQREQGFGVALRLLLLLAFAGKVGIIGLAFGRIGFGAQLLKPRLDAFQPRVLLCDDGP